MPRVREAKAKRPLVSLSWGSLPCGYYRHPSSAAWIPAPSGCRLRGSPGMLCHPRKSIVFLVPEFFRGPPKIAPIAPTDRGVWAESMPKIPLMGRRLFSFFGRPECGPLILEYVHLSVDGTLVPMPIGHRISATDTRKNHTFCQKMPLRAPDIN